MSRENAEKILSGEKTVEFREFKEHYGRMVLDKKVMKWREDNDAILSDVDLAYADPVRTVQTIHFYDYNKTFTLDVTVKETGIICINDGDVKMLQERFGCHEQDGNLEILNARGIPDNERQLLLYFAINTIISSSGSLSAESH